MNHEFSSVRWWRREAVADVDEGLLLHSSGRYLQWVLALEEAGPGRVEPVLVLDVGLGLGQSECLLANVLVFSGNRLNLLGGDSALGDQFVGIQVETVLVLADLLVHQGLREHGLVDLVVSIAAVSDQINNTILVESSTPLSSHLAHMHHGLWIVSVDVENRSIDDTSHIRTVGRGPRETGIGGETDLVVGHHMDSSVGGVVGQVRKMHSFIDDALSAEGGITVDQNGHNLLALLVATVELLGTGLALHHGIHSLQMGRVGHDSQADVLVCNAVQSLDVCTEMVLDITRALESKVIKYLYQEDFYLSLHHQQPPVQRTG